MIILTVRTIDRSKTVVYKSADHQHIWSEKLGYGKAKPRRITGTCGQWKSIRGYGNKIKPAFAQHRRDMRNAFSK